MHSQAGARCTYCGYYARNDTVLNRHIGHTPACQEKAAKALQQQVLDVNNGTSSPASNKEATQACDEDSTLDASRNADVNNPAVIEDLDDAAHQVDLDFNERERERDAANAKDQASIPNRNPILGPSPSFRYVQEYPRPAGIPISNEKTPSKFHKMEKTYPAQNGSCHPFASRAEYGLAKWLVDSVGQGDADEYLKLDFVSFV